MLMTVRRSMLPLLLLTSVLCLRHAHSHVSPDLAVNQLQGFYVCNPKQ